jgi:hypothetical protein
MGAYWTFNTLIWANKLSEEYSYKDEKKEVKTIGTSNTNKVVKGGKKMGRVRMPVRAMKTVQIKSEIS